MPRVGSSRISTRGLIASHLPSTTFCWLPPDRFTTCWWMDGVLMRKRATSASATRRSARAVEQAQARVAVRRPGSDVFCGDRHRQHQAVPLAVFGRQEHAARRSRRAGARGAKAGRRASSCRASAGVTPKIVCISSVRPEPTRPAKPRISPRPAVKRDAARARPAPAGPGPRAPVSGAASLGARREVVADSSRPTISATIVVVRRLAARRGRPTLRPSRSTVTRSARSSTSSMRCEM